MSKAAFKDIKPREVQDAVEDSLVGHYGAEGFHHMHYADDYKTRNEPAWPEHWWLKESGFKNTDFVSNKHPYGYPINLNDDSWTKLSPGELANKKDVWRFHPDSHNGLYPDLVVMTTDDGKEAEGYWCTDNPVNWGDYEQECDASIFKVMSKGFPLDLTNYGKTWMTIKETLDDDSEYQPVVSLDISPEEGQGAEIACNYSDTLMVHLLGAMAAERIEHQHYPKMYLPDVHDLDNYESYDDAHDVSTRDSLGDDILDASAQLMAQKGHCLVVNRSHGVDKDSDGATYEVVHICEVPVEQDHGEDVWGAPVKAYTCVVRPDSSGQVIESQIVKHSPNGLKGRIPGDEAQQVFAPGCKISDVRLGSPIDFIMDDIKGKVRVSEWMVKMNKDYELVDPKASINAPTKEPPALYMYEPEDEADLTMPALKTSHGGNKSVDKEDMSL